MSKIVVTFELIEGQSDDGRPSMTVHPSFESLNQNSTGNLMLVSIAANCVRTLSKTMGLEAALDHVVNATMNHTHMHPTGARE